MTFIINSKAMRVLALFIILLGTKVQSQTFQTNEICYDTFPSINNPGQDSLVARECYVVTVINNLACDLDFFFDYSCHPCGDVLPAFDSSSMSNVVPSGGSRVFPAYELSWFCGDLPVTCVCPCGLKFRVGSPGINPGDPFAPEPWPMLNALHTANGITYMTTILCQGVPINIHVQVNGNQSTFTFF